MAIRYLKKHGVVFVTALVAMAVMFIVGVTFMGMATNQYNDAKRDLQMLHALAAADAGIDYVIHKKLADQEAIGDRSAEGIVSGDGVDIRALTPGGTPAPTYPVKQIGNNNEDEFATWLLTMPDNPDAFQVISRGKYRDRVRMLRVLLRAPQAVPSQLPILDYAVFSDTSMDLKSWSYIDGSVGSNNNITMKSNVHITEDVFVIGQLDRSGNNTQVDGVVKTGEPYWFPAVPFAEYKERALQFGTVIEGDWRPNNDPATGNSYTFPPTPPESDPPVVYVEGDVHITSHFTVYGVGTIVATGTIFIDAHVDSDALTPDTVGLTLVAGERVKVTAQVDIDAFIYCDGTYEQTAHAVVTGAVIASETAGKAQSEVYYRRPAAPPVLPGNDPQAWTVASWEVL